VQVLPFHILLDGMPGYRVLCNLEPLYSERFGENLFDKVVYAKAAESAEVIDLTVRG
jgi:hypothetical protein